MAGEQKYAINECLGCNSPISHRGKHCRSCETKRRWENGLMPKMKANITSFRKGRRYSILTEFKKGQVPWNLGIAHMQGKNHPNWRGGISTATNIRCNSKWWKEIRLKVYARDKGICQKCKDRCINKTIVAHHIVPTYNDGGHSLDNLQTLCRGCHFIVHQKLREMEGRFIYV